MSIMEKCTKSEFFIELILMAMEGIDLYILPTISTTFVPLASLPTCSNLSLPMI